MKILLLFATILLSHPSLAKQDNVENEIERLLSENTRLLQAPDLIRHGFYRLGSKTTFIGDVIDVSQFNDRCQQEYTRGELVFTPHFRRFDDKYVVAYTPERTNTPNKYKVSAALFKRSGEAIPPTAKKYEQILSEATKKMARFAGAVRVECKYSINYRASVYTTVEDLLPYCHPKGYAYPLSKDEDLIIFRSVTEHKMSDRYETLKLKVSIKKLLTDFLLSQHKAFKKEAKHTYRPIQRAFEAPRHMNPYLAAFAIDNNLASIVNEKIEVLHFCETTS